MEKTCRESDPVGITTLEHGNEKNEKKSSASYDALLIHPTISS